MTPAPRIGFRREVLILVPTSLLVLLVLAMFTLLSYRSAVAEFVDAARADALAAARGAAARLARERSSTPWPPSSDRLAMLLPHASGVALLDRAGRFLAESGELSPGAQLAAEAPTDLAGAVALGPGDGADERVVVVAPFGPRTERYHLRADFDAHALGRQRRTVQVLSVVVIGLGLGVGVLSMAFVRHLVAPLDTLLERARAAVPEPNGVDEIPFLLDTFDRALAALSQTPAADDDDIRVLGRTLTPSLDCGLLLLSPQGRVLALNTQGRELLSTDEPISGQPHEELLRDCPELAAVVGDAIAGRRDDPRAEVVVHRGQAKEIAGVGGGAGDSFAPAREIGVTVHELRRETREVRGYLVLFADLTDVQRRSDQRRLSESLAHMGELTAGIAHEMRNSLSSLRGYLSRVEKHAADGAVRADVDEIRHEADHLKRILDDFLSFAQPGSVRMAEVSLERVVRRAASDLEIAGKAVSIQSSEPEGPRPIRRVLGDAQLLERALRNLLQNAADAEAEAGRPDGTLLVRIDVTASGPTVTIEDHGAGLRADIAERLFVPFVSHKGQGIGLGLAIARRILDLHGAALELENRDGGGVRARIRFPLSSVVTRESPIGETEIRSGTGAHRAG